RTPRGLPRLPAAARGSPPARTRAAPPGGAGAAGRAGGADRRTGAGGAGPRPAPTAAVPAGCRPGRGPAAGFPAGPRAADLRPGARAAPVTAAVRLPARQRRRGRLGRSRSDPADGRRDGRASLRDSVAEAGSAVVDLTRRTADETVGQGRLL